ncbi:protein-L-isoaspartate O-methyltransferase [Streptacidiphilus anmyonensis]|uniref:protein-L-isoaspartate O-methyltransferase n=1 Tax=Streptacidiphilus anmyonensis TaxID=405782 RepID=UPI000AA162B2|nr:protein-L-isoaspartate O-methyltransferase [Streptacidiphilus anmyonensis]
MTEPDELVGLRKRTDAAMAERGAWPERSAWLREACAALPRDRFAPERLWRWDGHAYVAVDRTADPARWAGVLFAGLDAAAVTQVTAGLPSSSLSAPAVVVDMMDALQLEPGHRVWDVGTGQGWTCALAAWRAGPGLVVSTETDPRLAASAQERLDRLGVRAEVHVGDGTRQAPGPGRFERIHVTYAVERVPMRWLARTKPGGRIVYPWGRLGHVALTVEPGAASASGPVLGLGQFMPDRHAPAPAGPAGYQRVRGSRAPDSERTLVRDLATLREDWNLTFALRVAVPDAVVATAVDSDGVNAWLHDGDRSWAALSATGQGTVALFQGGPRRLGDDILEAWDQWEELGRPAPTDYGITVTPTAQWAWLRDPSTGPRWPAGRLAAAIT